jgi:hypothetical protein
VQEEIEKADTNTLDLSVLAPPATAAVLSVPHSSSTELLEPFVSKKRTQTLLSGAPPPAKKGKASVSQAEEAEELEPSNEDQDEKPRSPKKSTKKKEKTEKVKIEGEEDVADVKIEKGKTSKSPSRKEKSAGKSSRKSSPPAKPPVAKGSNPFAKV